MMGFMAGTILDKIKFYLPHGKIAKDANDKWNRRCKRVDYKKLFAIVIDPKNIYRGEHMSLKLLNKFLSLPYKFVIITNDKRKANIYNNTIIFLKLKRYSSDLLFI